MEIHRRRIAELEEKLQNLQSQTALVAEVGGNQWHDNASYDLLVIDIRGVDHRLSEAHRVLNQAEFVEPPRDADRVRIGTKAQISVSGERQIWVIAGYGESDPDNGFIAYNTPLAQCIVGRRTGETTIGEIGGKRVAIEIIEISLAGE